MDATDGYDAPEVVRRRILRSHRETLVGLIDAGSEVAAAWDGETAGSRVAILSVAARSMTPGDSWSGFSSLPVEVAGDRRQ